MQTTLKWPEDYEDRFAIIRCHPDYEKAGEIWILGKNNPVRIFSPDEIERMNETSVQEDKT